jgi:hypothetical protein
MLTLTAIATLSRRASWSATCEQVADVLGNSPAVVRKYYGKWSKGRHDNIDRLIKAHCQTGPVTVSSVKKVNLEPVNQ